MSVTQLPEETVLQAMRLRVRFSLGGRLVLKNVSFAVHPGEIVCVIGPNGAGKTTLLNILSGNLIKRRCKVNVLGQHRWRHNYNIRRETTYVPATYGYDLGYTPYEHFKAVGLIYGMEQDAFAARCNSLVADLNYEPYVHQPWHSLSLGLHHKGMMIGGFLPPARLRIFDEPVASGIDPLGMEILSVWMKEARAKGESIIFSTQVLDRAHMLADKLLILKKGEIAYWGTSQQLIQQVGVDPADDYALNKAFFKLFRKDEES